VRRAHLRSLNQVFVVRADDRDAGVSGDVLAATLYEGLGLRANLGDRGGALTGSAVARVRGALDADTGVRAQLGPSAEPAVGHRAGA
jgi:hypothetical protein